MSAEINEKKTFKARMQAFYGKCVRGMEKLDSMKAVKAWLWMVLISAVSLLFVLLPFVFRNTYTVWTGGSGDGATQFVTFFEHMKGLGWLRAIGSYDFYVGLGGDYLTSFSFYSLFDPFNCILFGLPFNAMANYTITMALKQLACALTMFAYLRYKKVRNSRAMMLSVAYMLSGFVAFTFVRHYNLAVGPIYLPLAIMGVDKLFNKERPYVFIVAVFLCLVSNFYVFFSMSVFVVAYAIAYYFHNASLREEKKTVKGFFCKLLPVGAYYLLAVALAGVVLLPNLYGYMHAARNGSKGVQIFNFQMFLTQGASLMVPMTAKNYSVVSINVANAVLVLYALFKKDKRTRLHAWFVILLTIGYLMPLFGYAMNIFNYSNNRWSYGLNFFAYVLIALQSTDGNEEEYDDTSVKKINGFFVAYIAVLAASALPCVMTIAQLTEWWYYVLSVAIAIGVGYAAYRVIRLIKSKGVPKIFKKIYQPTILFVLGFALTIGYCVSYYAIYSSQHDGKERYATLFSQEELYIAEQSKGEYFRGDAAATGEWYNNFGTRGMNNGYYGTSLYNTISDSGVHEFLKENGVYNPEQNLGMSGLDSRYALQTLLSVKYSYDVFGNPYGFSKVDGYANLYENDNYLPFGFVTDKVYSRQQYLSLPVLERQYMLLNGVVLDGAQDNETEFTSKLVVCPVEDNQGMQVLRTIPKKTPRIITVDMDETDLRGHEVYFVIKGVKGVKKNTLIIVEHDGVQKEYSFSPKGNLMYSDMRDIYLHFGVVDANVSELTFKVWVEEGDEMVRFDDMAIHAAPVSEYQASLNKLATATTLQNVKLSRNAVKGHLVQQTDGYLLLTLPYSEGWTAYVNGKETQILKADTAFMALKITGSNETQTVVLRYETPYLKEGKAVTFLGVGALGGVILCDSAVRWLKKRKDKKQEENENV